MSSVLHPPSQEKILVIKLGALGDFVQALGAMAAIRDHHPDAHITLMTTKPFENFGKKCGYFNDVIMDVRPKVLDISGWIKLRNTLIKQNFKRVYDLQNNDRTSLYFRLFPKNKRPEWVGAAKGASHENNSPLRTAGHAFDGHVQTLAFAGIHNIKIDTLVWANEDISAFALKPPYVLFVAGCAPQHPQKRWPAEYYGHVAKILNERGFQPVILGTDNEKDIAETILNICPSALNLTGRTSLLQIAALAQKAVAAIGNDTGPMHMIAPTGCPCLVLFSSHSNPIRHTPKGEKVSVIQKPDLKTLDISIVLEKTLNIIGSSADIHTSAD